MAKGWHKLLQLLQFRNAICVKRLVSSRKEAQGLAILAKGVPPPSLPFTLFDG